MAKIQKLPRAVEEANRRADEILAEMNKEPEDSVPENDPDVVEVQDNTTSEKLSLDEPKVQKQETVQTNDPKHTPEYFEHRLKTVQGMWEADKRRFQEELARQKSEADARVTRLEEKLKQAPEVPKQYDLRTYFDENEIEQFGDNLPKLVLRVASKISAEEAERVVSRKMETEVEPLRREVETNRNATQERARDQFWSTLAAQVPNWQEINTNPQFHAWLSEVEPLVGVPRQSILTQAEQSLDAQRVVMIFNTFGNSMKQAQSEINSRLAKRELPDSVSPAPSTQVDNAPVFTSSQIKKHYDDLARGLYKNKMDKWVQLERRINDAYAAGRVSPG